MPDNFRHAQYDAGGVQIDDPQFLDQFTSTEVAQIRALVSGDGIVNSRDGMNRVTGFTAGDISYSVTYGNFGVDTISGGGQIMTVNRSASGLVTSVTTV